MRLPGTVTKLVASGVAAGNVTYSGVTTSILGGGDHITEIAFDCADGTSSNSSGATAGLTYLVLGS